MQSTLKRFLRAVEESRALTREQKDLLTEHPEDFSDAYRQNVIAILVEFNQRSMARERELRVTLEQEYQVLMRKLYAEGIDPHVRDAMLHQARTQLNAFFPGI